MNIKLISTQIYDDHEDKIEELYETAELTFIDKNVIVKYNKNEINFDNENKSVKVIREGNEIFIELNNENTFDYETPYGKIKMKTIGEKFLIEENPFKFTIAYKIVLNDTISYKNIIEIVVVK